MSDVAFVRTLRLDGTDALPLTATLGYSHQASIVLYSLEIYIILFLTYVALDFTT